MNTQPEALRLADALDDEFTQGRISNHNGRKAANELRRLHERQWVGLTDEDYKDLSKIAFIEVIEKIERVLKEKNA